eukprot:scaffold316983_cov162-Cyclotella_meneghiniana.AAC.1
MSSPARTSSRQSEADPPEALQNLSQSSTLIENDDNPARLGQDSTDIVSLLGQTISTSMTEVEPTTVVVPHMPPIPVFTTVKPKKEKIK